MTDIASMRPRLIGRGNFRPERLHRLRRYASMRPRLIGRGNTAFPASEGCLGAGFNEAPTYRSGKCPGCARPSADPDLLQ